MIEIWLALRLLFSKKTFGQSNTKVALAGLIIGVACLVVAMAVMSGFERTLKQAVMDVTGHIQVIRSSGGLPDWDDVEKRLPQMEPRLKDSLRFVFLEAVLARQGETLGVSIQGLDSRQWQKVLNFSKRVRSGSLDLSSNGGPKALIGSGLAQRMGISLGEKIKVVVPIADTLDPNRFSRRVGEFEVSGVLDFGRYDWNERFILVDLAAAQELTQIGDRISGLIYTIKDPNLSREVVYSLSRRLGFSYMVREWREFNQNLFQASQGEKVIIFFVVFIIVLVAAFSVASSFYVNVYQRYPDLAIFKTLGLTQKSLIKIYALKGLFLGLMGVGLGYLLGLALCFMFVGGQRLFHLIPGSVYHLSEIQIQLNPWDTLAIVFSTLLICILASVFPARRGAQLSPVEGLRYE